MQIVIDIEKDDYKTIKSNYENGFTYKPFGIIANGTPLPKGHGRLIDADKLINGFELSDLEGDSIDNLNNVCSIINSYPTIIEADKEE